MARKAPFARIAITLPSETLRAADELAARHDRSRSWIVAEAIRQYAAAQRNEGTVDDATAPLGPSRLAQLRRDLALPPEVRLREGEDPGPVGGPDTVPVSPQTFASYDAFVAWRRERAGR